MSHASKEAFAAFLDHSDDQIGRFVDSLRRLGRLDNMIIIVLADNGASQEGGPFVVLHEMKFFNGIIESPDDAIARLDEIGGPDSHTDYPWGWAQCGNTPYRWYKQNAHEGGVHVPMVVHWPAGVAPDQSDTLRERFVFASDIAATIYDLLGIEAPLVRNGVDQLPVAGHSFAAALADPSAPATNDVQYFENGGSRALIAGEWKAVCKHVAGADYDTEAWELYHLSVDRSECDDLAGTLLAKLALKQAIPEVSGGVSGSGRIEKVPVASWGRWWADEIAIRGAGRHVVALSGRVEPVRGVADEPAVPGWSRTPVRCRSERVEQSK